MRIEFIIRHNYAPEMLHLHETLFLESPERRSCTPAYACAARDGLTETESRTLILRAESRRPPLLPERHRQGADTTCEPATAALTMDGKILTLHTGPHLFSEIDSVGLTRTRHAESKYALSHPELT